MEWDKKETTGWTASRASTRKTPELRWTAYRQWSDRSVKSRRADRHSKTIYTWSWNWRIELKFFTIRSCKRFIYLNFEESEEKVRLYFKLAQD